MGRGAEIDCNGTSIRLGNPDKILYPEAGLSKYDIARYYLKTADLILPWLKGRPITMRRFPDGIGDGGFFNKHMPDHFPDWMPAHNVPQQDESAGDIRMVGAESPGHLVYLADQGVIEFHISLSPARHYEYPDTAIFDLDPAGDDTGTVRDVALAIYEILCGLNLPSFLKTSGSSGYHIHIPLKGDAPFAEIKPACAQIADYVVRTTPRTTLEKLKKERGDNIFIDYLRNEHGQTAIAPYGLRALEHAPVAVPLEWKELERAFIHPQKYTLANLARRVGQKGDVWQDFHHHAVSGEEFITAAGRLEKA